jgi:glycosyltransferase involved in cell wall biosynthesis
MNVIRIAFLIRKLEIGGAERQLAQLAKGLDPKRFCPLVLTFYPGGAFEQELIDAGVRVQCLNKQGRWDLLAFQYRLIRALRDFRPHLIHAFQGPPNLLALLARPLAPGMRVIWGFRASNMDLSKYDYSRRVVATVMRRVSQRMDLAIANSNAGKAHAVSQGYNAAQFLVVPNGIDINTFHHDADIGLAVRRKWGVLDNVPLIGIVARLDRKKDHSTFLAAAAGLSIRHPTVRFVCIGEGSPEREAQLRDEAHELGITEKVIWAGGRTDMAAVYNALDINTLASRFGEGFPNAIGEAMAVGVPCVVTDCGDAALIVDTTGVVVVPGDREKLTAGWEQLLSLSTEDREVLRIRCRDRIKMNFSTESMIARSAEIYADTAKGLLPPVDDRG